MLRHISLSRTKKKDIYVISTLQRPVPLEHYLYANRDMYKVVDPKRNFLAQGYDVLSFERILAQSHFRRFKEAGEALRRKQDKEREAAGLAPVQRVGARGAAPTGRGQGGRGGRGGQASTGRGGPPTGRGSPRGGAMASRSIHTATDKNLYVHLLGHLRKKSLLPVVVFTLSKKRCEENASTLTNADLCSAIEKSEVHVAIEKALSRLRGGAFSLAYTVFLILPAQLLIGNYLRLGEYAISCLEVSVSTMVVYFLLSRNSSKSCLREA